MYQRALSITFFAMTAALVAEAEVRLVQFSHEGISYSISIIDTVPDTKGKDPLTDDFVSRGLEFLRGEYQRAGTVDKNDKKMLKAMNTVESPWDGNTSMIIISMNRDERSGYQGLGDFDPETQILGIGSLTKGRIPAFDRLRKGNAEVAEQIEEELSQFSDPKKYGEMKRFAVRRKPPPGFDEKKTFPKVLPLLLGSFDRYLHDSALETLYLETDPRRHERRYRAVGWETLARGIDPYFEPHRPNPWTPAGMRNIASELVQRAAEKALFGKGGAEAVIFLHIDETQPGFARVKTAPTREVVFMRQTARAFYNCADQFIKNGAVGSDILQAFRSVQPKVMTLGPPPRSVLPPKSIPEKVRDFAPWCGARLQHLNLR